MAMKPCSKCKCSTWKFEFNDKTQEVTAICIFCKHKVQFLSKKGRKMKAGWVPPAPTTGVHAKDYVGIQHGPPPDAHGDLLVPPWIDFPERQAWLNENYPGETL